MQLLFFNFNVFIFQNKDLLQIFTNYSIILKILMTIMSQQSIHTLFQNAIYEKDWNALYSYLDAIVNNPSSFSKEIDNYCSNSHNVSYFLNYVAKNNKRQVDRILNYHIQLFSHLNDYDKNKCYGILSKLYLNFKNISKDYYFENSLTQKEVFNEFFKSVSYNGKEIFEKIKQEQNIDFFINQDHKNHHYSLKEALVHYLLTYEKIPFRKLSTIVQDIWTLLPNESYPVDILKVQNNLKPEVVRLYNFQNLPLPYKKEFNQPIELTIFKNSFSTTYKNAIFWNEFLMGVREVFQLHFTNRTPNGSEVRTMLDLVKSYQSNDFIQEIFPFYAKEKAKNAKTEKNKSLWQACLFELTLEELPNKSKRVKI